MAASKVNPNVWNGEERSGGYIGKNDKPTSANSPDYKGRLYLIGVGWFWVSGWTKNTRNGEILALRLQEMSDEQAAKFCKPKGPDRGKTTAPVSRSPPNGAAPGTDDIPF